MAKARLWPALDIRSAGIDDDGTMEGLIAAALHDHAPLAIHDFNPPPLPPGGSWDPTAPSPPEPPPTAVTWRVCFGEAAARDSAASAISALGLDLAIEPIDLPDDDWVTRSQQSLTAVDAGRFIVAPPWDRPAAVPPDREVIVIEPSMGFGTGHHQTTRLCLISMSGLDIAGRSVLDLGTGSGVLAMAASMLGAGDVRGLDIDADAIDAARRSAALNTLPAPVDFTVADAFADPPEPADVVLANLTGAMLMRVAARLSALVAPHGTLVISGFTGDERAGVEHALDLFEVASRTTEDEWCAAVLRRR